jgi:hypothetical protein
MQRQARLFRLVRHTGPDGVRGTGALADGVEWSDGAVALRSRGRWPSTSTWDCIESLLAAHGAGGRTQLHWLPATPLPVIPSTSSTAQHDVLHREEHMSTVWLPAPSADGLCSRCGQLWPCLSCGP